MPMNTPTSGDENPAPLSVHALDIEMYRPLYLEARQLVVKPAGSRLRLLVTGGRTYNDELAVEAVMRGLSKTYGPLHITDGQCVKGGLDDLAHKFAVYHGWGTERVPADWFAGWQRSGVNPGHVRNQAMVDMGHDLCVGWPEPESKGTWDCMNRALAAHIPTYCVLRPNLRVVPHLVEYAGEHD